MTHTDLIKTKHECVFYTWDSFSTIKLSVGLWMLPYFHSVQWDCVVLPLRVAQYFIMTVRTG